MTEPMPVDLSKLKGILGASKAIMNKVENNDYETGHIDARALTEDGVSEMYSEGIQRPAHTAQQPVQTQFSEEHIRNSNLPSIIKEAMINKPIPQLSGPSHTFTLDDVADLVDKPMGRPKAPKASPKQKASISESNMITIDRYELAEMINEIVDDKLLEFFTKSYNKTITEQTIKKTIGTLLKEGKITQKKKI